MHDRAPGCAHDSNSVDLLCSYITFFTCDAFLPRVLSALDDIDCASRDSPTVFSSTILMPVRFHHMFTAEGRISQSTSVQRCISFSAVYASFVNDEYQSYSFKRKTTKCALSLEEAWLVRPLMSSSSSVLCCHLHLPQLHLKPSASTSISISSPHLLSRCSWVALFLRGCAVSSVVLARRRRHHLFLTCAWSSSILSS